MSPLTIKHLLPEWRDRRLRWHGAAALAIVVPALGPVFQPGWFLGHDNLHLIRLFEQDLMMRAGHFPVRWYPDVSAGFGSPHPQFYAPLFYLIAQVFHFFKIPLDLSLKLSVATVLLGSSYAMYVLVRGWFGESAGLVAAVAYTYAPYHLLDLYVRSALSELTVFVTLPIAIASFQTLIREATRRRMAAAALSLAALLLSHTITSMLVPVLLGLWLSLHLLPGSGRSTRWLSPVLVAVILGFGLAAFFLLPLVTEAHAVQTDFYTSGYYSWNAHFVTPLQLLWSPWGYGISVPGTGDGMSFSLGLLQLTGTVAAFALLARARHLTVHARVGLVFAALLTIAGIFLSLQVSQPLWAELEQLRLFQFPWRFLLLTTFGMAVLCGYWAYVLERGPAADMSYEPTRYRARRWLIIGIVGCAFLSGVPYLRFREHVPIHEITFRRDRMWLVRDLDREVNSDSAVFTSEFVKTNAIAWHDHLPKGVLPRTSGEDLMRPRLEVVAGVAQAQLRHSAALRYVIDVTAQATTIIRLNVHAFPGWNWRVNGVRQNTTTGPGPALLIQVPPGSHEVEAVFERTPPREIGDGITLVSTIVCFLLGLPSVASRRGQRKRADD